MKKKEYIAIFSLLILSIIMIFFLKFIPKKSNNLIEGAPSEDAKGEWIVIVYQNEIVQWFDSGIDASYTVNGDVSGLTVEVKDEKWHVKEVDCPNHNCKKMG